MDELFEGGGEGAAAAVGSVAVGRSSSGWVVVILADLLCHYFDLQ